MNKYLFFVRSSSSNQTNKLLYYGHFIESVTESFACNKLLVLISCNELLIALDWRIKNYHEKCVILLEINQGNILKNQSWVNERKVWAPIAAEMKWRWPLTVSIRPKEKKDGTNWIIEMFWVSVRTHEQSGNLMKWKKKWNEFIM